MDYTKHCQSTAMKGRPMRFSLLLILMLAIVNSHAFAADPGDVESDVRLKW